MLAILAIAAATAGQAMISQAVSPPPVVVAVQAPPPQPVISDVIRAYPQRVSAPTVMPIRVRVVAGGEQLLSETFRVSRNVGASYQLSRNEASETGCPATAYYDSQQRYSLNLGLYLRDEGTQPRVNVSVTWQRPSKIADCSGDGSRQVQLTQTVAVAPGQSVTIQGDAGLSVTLSR
jgi:hypothetical protein